MCQSVNNCMHVLQSHRSPTYLQASQLCWYHSAGFIPIMSRSATNTQGSHNATTLTCMPLLFLHSLNLYPYDLDLWPRDLENEISSSHRCNEYLHNFWFKSIQCKFTHFHAHRHVTLTCDTKNLWNNLHSHGKFY